MNRALPWTSGASAPAAGSSAIDGSRIGSTPFTDASPVFPGPSVPAPSSSHNDVSEPGDIVSPAPPVPKAGSAQPQLAAATTARTDRSPRSPREDGIAGVVILFRPDTSG